MYASHLAGMTGTYLWPWAIVKGWCVRQIYLDPNAYWLHQTRATGCRSIVSPIDWVYPVMKCHIDDKVMYRFISMTPSAITFTHQIPKKKEKKKNCFRHHVSSYFFLQAGRHFISWLYSFWVGSSPHLSVIAMLKMAHPSRWGLACAINRRAPQRRICLWVGSAQNRLFADVVSSALPSHSEVSTEELQILFWGFKRVVQHALEKKRISMFCFMNLRNNLSIYLNWITNLGGQNKVN